MSQPNKLAILFTAVIALSVTSLAQPSRIAGIVDDSQAVVLKGHAHPSFQLQNAKGLVENEYQLTNITMSFKGSAKQQADLKQLLDDQQNPSSPNFHRWLTPQQYADRFGLSRSDIHKVVAWLTSHGFTIEKVATGRNWVRFSGSAQQVTNAFHTEIHRYEVNGVMHVANASEPSVPKALAGMIIGIRGLDDFRPHPSSFVKTVIPNTSFLLQTHPDFSSGGSNYLAPDDIATIYNLGALLNATPTAFDASGQTIAIVGQSQVAMTDISAFRSLFGQSALTPQVVTVPPDPGLNSAEIEGDLDLEWTGAVARKAALIYDVAFSAFTAAEDVIDNNRAPVLSISYSLCEAAATLAPSQQFQAEVQKGNSMGITTLASSGDAGAAACDDQNSQSFANQGLAVNIPASIPEVTAVGGTEFNEGTGSYWGTNGTHSGSALGYIPEMGWNDGALGTNSVGGLWGTGGGVSMFFAKPSWQTGPGVPADAFRDVPDVSMNASGGHDGYLLCQGNSCPTTLAVVGGTSASTPVLAGLLAILNQYSVVKGIQATPGMGRINDRLYALAQSNPTFFHDVTIGSNMVQCTNGTPNCTAPADSFGYTANVGYDLVTGLGSVDANALVGGFAQKTTTTTALTSSSTTIVLGSSVTLTATVSPSSGTAVPTGTVNFSVNGRSLGFGTLNASGVAVLTSSSFPAGLVSISSSYGGDALFSGSSNSIPLTVQDFTVDASPTSISMSPGGNGTTSITLSPNPPTYAPTANISCTGAPAEATCSVTPSSTTVNGSAVSLNVTTTAPHALKNTIAGNGRFGFMYAMFLPLLGIVGLARRRNHRGALGWMSLTLVLAMSTLWLSSCGGGNSGPSDPGTPAGNYSLTVTVTTSSGTTLTKNLTVPLTVQ